MHKWYSHARWHLVTDISLYAALMILFISDLSIVGLTMGRSFISVDIVHSSTLGLNAATAHSLMDNSSYGLASTVQELCMACICLRNLWCDVLSHAMPFLCPPHQVIV
jgi:hypothetical protein